MSHVVDGEIIVKDIPSLTKAARDIGMELIPASTYKWFGRHMGDYKLPEGFTKEELGRCEYVIRIPDNKEAYEVGVVRKNGQYRLLWDFWNKGYGLMDKIGQDGEILMQAYGVRVAKKELMIAGFDIGSTEVLSDGEVLITTT